MKRIFLVLAVAALMAMMVVVMAAPAFAEGPPCPSGERPQLAVGGPTGGERGCVPIGPAGAPNP